MKHSEEITGYRLRMIFVLLMLAGYCYQQWFARAAAAQFLAMPVEQAERLFLEKVWPVIETQCLTCHSGPASLSELELSSRAGMIKGGTRGASLVPGDAVSSLLFLAIERKVPARGFHRCRRDAIIN
jgi:hypothetical protein